MTFLARIAVFFAIVLSFSQASAQTVWRFALEELPGSVQHAYALEFKRRIEAKSAGEVEVIIYPLGTLGNSSELTELVAMGAIQFAHATPGILGSLIPEVQVFLLPALFPANEEANKEILAGSEAIYGILGKAYEEKGLTLLSVYSEGEMVWTTRKPVTQPEDFRNLKMRVMASPMLVASYDAFGASPTPMPYGEVYSGLQLKLIDGQVNPVFAIEEMKFYEVSNYMIWPKQEHFITSVISNQEWFSGLPVQQRALIRETAQELQEYIFPLQRQYNAQRLAHIKQRSPELTLITLSKDQQATFAKAALPVRQLYIEETGMRGRRILETLLHEIHQIEENQYVNGTVLPIESPYKVVSHNHK